MSAWAVLMCGPCSGPRPISCCRAPRSGCSSPAIPAGSCGSPSKAPARATGWASANGEPSDGPGRDNAIGRYSPPTSRGRPLKSSTRTIPLLVILAGGLAVAGPGRLSSQGVLSQFTYDELRLSGFQLDFGSVTTKDLRGALIGGVRVDVGHLAPPVRVLLGLSYTRSRFTERAVTRFNRTLLKLVTDPDGNATIDVGRVNLSDLIADVDLQYVFNEAGPVSVVAGVGGGAHIRDGSGSAINGTFLEDALDGVAPTPAWQLTGELRGTLLSDCSTASARVGFMYRLPGARGSR